MSRQVITVWPPGFRVETPFGHGMIWYMRHEGDEADMMWGVMHDDRRMIEVPNYQMRGQYNYSIGRTKGEGPAKAPDELLTRHKQST